MAINITYGETAKAVRLAEQEVKDTTPSVQRGKPALAFKGRKIKPGTEVQVFWIGERRNCFSNAMELRAGVTLPDGSKVFCDAGNLQPIPTDTEMTLFAAAQKALTEAREAEKDM